jgi:hypothetical protein
MQSGPQTSQNASVDKYLAGLKSSEVLLPLKWEEWLQIGAPYPEVKFTKKGVSTRFSRNGYDWDIHGTLYTPEKEVDPSTAFLVCHGNLGSEAFMEFTPDGRPGIASVLAAQGFKALAITYPGHYQPPDGIWKTPIEQRSPIYLFDRELPPDEVADRNLKATFNLTLQGAAQIADENLSGRKLLITSGPMAAYLWKFSKKTETLGLACFGHGGPDCWRLEWRDKTKAEEYSEYPIDKVFRRSAKSLRASGYEGPADLTPYGRAEDFITWAEKMRSQIKTSICINQHSAALPALEKYVVRTGLPREEYFDYLDEPDPNQLKKMGVLLLVGEGDKHHWIEGDKLEDKRDMFMALKFKKFTDRTHLVLIPRHGHMAYADLHNEKIPYLWLWAVKNKFFAR